MMFGHLNYFIANGWYTPILTLVNKCMLYL